MKIISIMALSFAGCIFLVGQSPAPGAAVPVATGAPIAVDTPAMVVVRLAAVSLTRITASVAPAALVAMPMRLLPDAVHQGREPAGLCARCLE